MYCVTIALTPLVTLTHSCLTYSMPWLFLSLRDTHIQVLMQLVNNMTKTVFQLDLSFSPQSFSVVWIFSNPVSEGQEHRPDWVCVWACPYDIPHEPCLIATAIISHSTACVFSEAFVAKAPSWRKLARRSIEVSTGFLRDDNGSSFQPQILNATDLLLAGLIVSFLVMFLLM